MFIGKVLEYSKLIIRVTKQLWISDSALFIVKSELISIIIPVFVLLTLDMF